MASTNPALSTRLTLLCCAGTAMARSGGFAGADEPLDDGGLRLARAFRLAGPAPAVTLSSPSAAARETAAAIGSNAQIDSALADMGWGAWDGRSFASIQAEDADALMCWLADPATGTPGGERFAVLAARVAPWLATVSQSGDRTVGITHPMTIRAILSAAIGLPSEAAMRIDIAPLSLTELSFRGGWRLQGLTPA